MGTTTIPQVPVSGPIEDKVRHLRNTLDGITNLRLRILFDSTRSVQDRQTIAELVVEAAEQAYSQLVQEIN